MPGHRVFLQDGGEVRDALKCSYCKLVLRDPVQTSETGQRFCRDCFDKASKDPSGAIEVDPKDEIWPDFAVKREIAHLKVKCENYYAGCDWEGLFKQLMEHSQQCQYVTVECRNPGCGQRVLLAKIEIHLREECPQRRVRCEDCGCRMYFSELQDHKEVCPNAIRACKNCNIEMPANKLADHMTNECKHIKCVCKEDNNIFEVESTQLYAHLKDFDKLGTHLAPIICEVSRLSEVVKGLTVAHHQAVGRIEVLEKRNVVLEDGMKQANEKTLVAETKFNVLEKKVEILEKENIRLSQETLQLRDSEKLSLAVVPKSSTADSTEVIFQQIENISLSNQQITSKVEKRLSSIEEMMNLASRSNSQLLGEIENLKRQYMARSSSNAYGEVIPFEKPSSDLIKQVEEKVLEVERTVNVLSVHHSELELQLQASLASTHNGAFLWRIPEVRRRIRDAKQGRITSIYSPPFYTGRNGYKMCIRAYLNGDGTGEETHLSIFFVLMRGEYDPLLRWPFEPKVSLILVDQDHKKHLVQTFKPNPQSSSFQRPKTDMNVASGCPEFADLSVLDNTSYVKDDVMYIKAIVDTSKVFHP